jgi:hypothetical protein
MKNKSECRIMFIVVNSRKEKLFIYQIVEIASKIFILLSTQSMILFFFFIPQVRVPVFMRLVAADWVVL